MQDINEKLKYLSSYASKLLRKKYGRGPESSHGVVHDRFIIFYFRGFISPVEEALLKQSQHAHVDKARHIIIQVVMEELKGAIQTMFDIEISSFYHDWNFPNNTGVIIAECQDSISPIHNLQVNPEKIKGLEAEVTRISERVQKVPDEINTYIVSSRIILVERLGILIEIEEALIEKGFAEELRFTKDELEKSYFHRNTKIEEILSLEIEDIFIDWDFKRNKSIMCFVLSDSRNYK